MPRPLACKAATRPPDEDPATSRGARSAPSRAARTPAWKGVPKKLEDITSVYGPAAASQERVVCVS